MFDFSGFSSPVMHRFAEKFTFSMTNQFVQNAGRFFDLIFQTPFVHKHALNLSIVGQILTLALDCVGVSVFAVFILI